MFLSGYVDVTEYVKKIFDMQYYNSNINPMDPNVNDIPTVAVVEQPIVATTVNKWFWVIHHARNANREIKICLEKSHNC